MADAPPLNTQAQSRSSAAAQESAQDFEIGLGEPTIFSTQSSYKLAEGYSGASSPHSTISSLDRTMEDMINSQPSIGDNPELSSAQPLQKQLVYLGNTIILAIFSKLLEQGLEKASKLITTELKQEFKDLGANMDTTKQNYMPPQAEQTRILEVSKIFTPNFELCPKLTIWKPDPAGIILGFRGSLNQSQMYRKMLRDY